MGEGGLIAREIQSPLVNPGGKWQKRGQIAYPLGITGGIGDLLHLSTRRNET